VEVGADPGKLRIAFTSITPNGAPVEADSLRALAEAAKLSVESRCGAVAVGRTYL
jgi:hypothetical protein